MLSLTGSRLRDTRIMVLVEELLNRGARTPTVHRLTGVPEVTIRRMHHELYGQGPVRGPSAYGFNWFVDNPKRQFVASLAANALRDYISASVDREDECDKKAAPDPDKTRESDDPVSEADRDDGPTKWTTKPGRFLGEAYVNAYDFFRSNVSAWKHHADEIDFERFASLGHFLGRGNLLNFMSCARCGFSFVGLVQPSAGIRQMQCPSCLIKLGRECAHCGTYVPLDFGDFPPNRPPACITCACSQERVTTLSFFMESRRLYPSQRHSDLIPTIETILSRAARTAACLNEADHSESGLLVQRTA